MCYDENIFVFLRYENNMRVAFSFVIEHKEDRIFYIIFCTIIRIARNVLLRVSAKYDLFQSVFFLLLAFRSTESQIYGLHVSFFFYWWLLKIFVYGICLKFWSDKIGCIKMYSLGSLRSVLFRVIYGCLYVPVSVRGNFHSWIKDSLNGLRILKKCFIINFAESGAFFCFWILIEIL